MKIFFAILLFPLVGFSSDLAFLKGYSEYKKSHHNSTLYIEKIGKSNLQLNLRNAFGCYEALSHSQYNEEIGFEELVSFAYFLGYKNGKKVIYFTDLRDSKFIKSYYIPFDNSALKGSDSYYIAAPSGRFRFIRKGDNFRLLYETEKVKLQEGLKTLNMTPEAQFTDDTLKSLSFWLFSKIQNITDEYETYAKDKDKNIHGLLKKDIHSSILFCKTFSSRMGPTFKKILAIKEEELNPTKAKN
jgi:hypothetical protein